MAAQYKTQCPHCQAQFRISEEHLKQAKGKVRCGSCLQVFLATDHLVDQPAATKPAAPVASKPVAKQPVAAAPKPPAAAKPAPTKPAATKPAATKPAPAAAREKWALPADEAKPAAPAAPASRWTMDEEGHDTEAFDDNDDFAEDEIPEARPQANDTKVSLGSIELSDSFMSLDEDGDERLRSEDFSDMAGAGRKGDKPGHDSDESWADKLLEELEEDKPPKTPTTADKMSLSETEEETRSQQNRQQKKKRRQEASPLDDLAEPDWAQDSPGAAFSNDDGFDFLNEADDDDVAAIELPRAEKKKVAPTIQFDSMIASGAEILRWGALSALMVALFALQYSSFHFDRLARTPEWRGFYSTVCNTFGCVLPNPSDLDNLRGANLVVRKHPVYSNALIVDVLLFNRASYEQPFPVLELGFTTLQGAAVASRRFTPAEYLNAELAKTNAMPIDTPVHVSLEILDPGAEAVNYTLRFFPAPQSGA